MDLKQLRNLGLLLGLGRWGLRARPALAPFARSLSHLLTHHIHHHHRHQPAPPAQPRRQRSSGFAIAQLQWRDPHHARVNSSLDPRVARPPFFHLPARPARAQGSRDAKSPIEGLLMSAGRLHRPCTCCGWAAAGFQYIHGGGGGAFDTPQTLRET